MSKDAPISKACPRCGQPLPDRKQGNLCPACLMAEALGPIETLDGDLDESLLTNLPQDENLPDPLEGTTLGPAGRYKILQRIGEGGFGVVYMAEQISPVRRRVAIKILKAGMDTRQVIARFEAERQALAMMDHPNIAKVLDGGETEQGRPYFVMELVRGTPVTTFCDREQLDTTARLSLFLQICRAVQHAHQKGIIHRDLKPANILITMPDGAEPVPKVIDFGVAKAMEANLTDKTLFTRFEQMLGTPAYMSPEQAGTEGTPDIDTRADIYALGILLYELLTGSTPFDSATLQSAAFEEIRRILRDEEAPRPSARLSSLESERRKTLASTRNAASPETLDKQLRGDLDWIVMKAIEKDRRRRYETANAFALDLERYLDDAPIEARPPSTTYRLQKFARRHKSALTLAATILVILVAASIVSTVSAVKATDANNRANKNFTDLQTAYTDLDSANKIAQKAQHKTQDLLVHTLLEKGTSQFNEGNVTGLFTLQEAVDAAEGNATLQTKALELWTLAHAWLPGSIEHVIDNPHAVALASDGSILAWCNSVGLHIFRPKDPEPKNITIAKNLTELLPSPARKSSVYLELALSRTNDRLAVFNIESGVAQVWDVKSGKPITPLLRHPETGNEADLRMMTRWTKIAFDHDGRYLATVSVRGSVCLWDVDAGKLARPPWTYETSSHFTNLSLSTSGARLALSSYKKIHIIDLTQPDFPESKIESDYPVHRTKFINDSQILSVDFSQATLWNIASGEAQAVYSAPWDEDYHMLQGVALASDGRTFALASRRGELPLLSAKATTLDRLREPIPYSAGEPWSVGFNSRGTILASGGLKGSIRYWSTEGDFPVGVWPLPGNVAHIQTTESNDFLVGLQGNRPIQLRKFPLSLERQVGEIPADSRLLDVSPDGTTIVIMSPTMSSLSVLNSKGGLIAPGPQLQSNAEFFVSACLHPKGRELIYTTASPEKLSFRSWNFDRHENGKFSRDIERNQKITVVAQTQSVGAVLPTEPPLIVANPKNWRANLLDLRSSKFVKTLKLSHHPTCVVVSEDSGWFGIGTRSGDFSRFTIDTQKELGPALSLENPIVSAACTRKRNWLITVERNKEGISSLRAWLMRGEAPFFSLKMPLPFEGDEIHTVDDLGFVFQKGSSLWRLDLPDQLPSAHNVETLTHAALGFRKNASGEIELLKAKEFQSAKLTPAGGK